MEVNHRHQPWRSSWKLEPSEARHYSLSNFVESTPQSTETKPDKSRPRPYRLSFCRGQLGQSGIDPLYALDPEIEITLRRLIKTRSIVVNINSNFDSVIYSDQLSTDKYASSSNIFEELG
ncbi:hypothetical protein CR513_55281, partial [Mucuna pruriens]